MIISELPPEVIDIVLDFLHSDKDALMACSLTSTAWRPSSQYHLFREIELTPLDFHSFLDYADNSKSNITTLVRRLTIRSSGTTMAHVRFTPSASVSYLQKYLQGLESLRLYDIYWIVISAQVRQLLSFPNNLKTLELHYVRFESVRQTITFICSFPSLENLYIRSWSKGMPHELLDDAPKLPQSHPLHVHIAHMNLDLLGDAISFIEWLAGQDPCHTVELDTLRFGPINYRDIFMKESVRKLIRMNRTLNCLQIKAPQLPFERQDRDGERIFIHFIMDAPFFLIHDLFADYLRDFVQVMRDIEIQSLCFDFILMALDPFTPYRIAMVADILSKITWCCPQRVSFAFVIARGAHANLFNYERITDILTQPHFADLKQVRVSIHTHSAQGVGDDCAETDRRIRQGFFSVFDRRNMLDIEFTDKIEGIESYN